MSNCVCKHCHVAFYMKPSSKKKGRGVYCSKKCLKEYFAKGVCVDRKCLVCGKVYRLPPSHAVKNRFCSRACRGKWQSLNMKGDKNPNFNNRTRIVLCAYCGAEVIKKMYRILSRKKLYCSTDCSRLSMTGVKKPEISGSKHGSWKGGIYPQHLAIRSSIEYKRWRSMVFERDGYACVICKDSSGGNLNADHIKPFSRFPELRLDVDNGRTLCITCYVNGWRHYMASNRWRDRNIAWRIRRHIHYRIT